MTLREMSASYAESAARLSAILRELRANGQESVLVTRLDADGAFWIGFVAVLAEKRRQKLGDFIVRLLLDRAFLCGASEIFLTARPDSVPFFESIGFVVTGDPIESGVPMSVRRGGVKTACGGHHEPCPF